MYFLKSIFYFVPIFLPYSYVDIDLINAGVALK